MKYGKQDLNIQLSSLLNVDIIAPHTKYVMPLVNISIDFQPLISLLNNKGKNRSELIVGIAINDKTRPVPYPKLIPPLIHELIQNGIKENNIIFYIANGTHVPDTDLSYLQLEDYLINNYIFLQHDCNENLIYLGETSFGTKILINKSYYECDLKISVGNIEPHHFAGYSGGVKTVSIGLAGKETITHNHSPLMDDNSVACEYFRNKIRMDIEEIGDFAGVDLALNYIQNSDLQILNVFLENPKTVMQQAIPIIDKLHSVNVEKKYDFDIASAGGHPKDINFYQSQKAISNAKNILKKNASILIIAECKEGIGSDTYFNYVSKFNFPSEVITNFENKEFVIGHHKAYLMAKVQIKHKLYLYSNLAKPIVKSLMMEKVDELAPFINYFTKSVHANIAVMPNAVSTIPITKRR
ncbi:MAG: nickel-dependent lactate racemase [Anaerolineaceae bacterium]|nr:nickel-dependent lactate racemase [Anaerolineaceae bacterium]